MRAPSHTLSLLLLSSLLCGACAPAPAPRPPPARKVSAARPVPANLEKLVVATDFGVERSASPGHPGWSVPVALFPTSDPAWQRLPERKLAVGRTGTLLAGASDGSLLALDPDGHPLFQLGVRGAVFEIEPRPDGSFAVYSSSQTVTVVTPEGAVRERTDPAEVPWKPTVAHRALRVSGPDGKPFRNVLSVVALSSTDVWALVRPQAAPGQDPPPARLFHGDGKTWTDRGVPTVTFPKEVFAEGHPAETGTFVPHSLARSPKGALLVVGSRLGVARRASLLENTPQGLRERRDLVPMLAKFKTVRYLDGDVSYAASASGKEVICVVADGANQCAERGPDLPPRRLPEAPDRVVPDGRGDFPEGTRSRGTPLLFAGNTLWIGFGWAGSETDMWTVDRNLLHHHDGKESEERETPLGVVRSVWGSGKGDIWLTGDNGVARFDGTSWHRIFEIEGRSAAGYLFVTGSGPDDVWVYGEEGLWHIPPSPRPEPDLTATLAPAPNAAAPSLPLVMGPVDDALRIEKVELAIDGAPGLRHALRVAEGPGGLVWLHDGARLVEYDGTRARVLHAEPAPEPFVCWSAPVNDCELCAACNPSTGAPQTCQHCASPAAPGKGTLISGNRLLRIDPVDPSAATPELALLPDLQAVATTPTGTLWAVSASPDDDLPHAVILGPGGLRLVPSLPPAAYTDVAARADDDVWLAGALTSGLTGELAPRTIPAGEGTLVHFDGKAFTRHRAPDGPLVSVIATAPSEAWAVGVSGGLLHATPGVVQAYHLAREGGSRAPVILRAAASAAPSDVWIVGEGGTVLHGDAKSFRRVEVPLAGRDAAFSGVVAPTQARPGWLVGPSGIWKITRKP